MATKKITVYRKDDIKYSLAGKTLEDASKFLMSISSAYPKDAYIDVGCEQDYGDYTAYLVVSYRSEETDEELAYRVAREDQSAEYRRKQFEQLKKEFGDK